MGCLFAIFAGIFPRMAVFILWIARPALVGAVFHTWIWPLLGLIFLPFATLMYIILSISGAHLSGGDWVWIALAVVLDLLHWASMAARNRMMPGYSQPPPGYPRT
ncbi:hypothetical protein HTZ77_09955 [Nonomuraea sp. SMC257]|uniref:Uncharacterized protein n=2 Tax=Nonomuraea montanisoli TaxID=2741721 RepID=A0A7Y6I7C1_9ACTN|nr:hypothetical protein [Nonomuraea montanisoli]